jgi:hypothetical protein
MAGYAPVDLPPCEFKKSAEVIELSAARRPSGAESALARPVANPGNGAREALDRMFRLMKPNPTLKAADSALLYLWVEGFKVVPLEDKDWRA